MKKTYFLLLLAFSCLSFGQTNNTCSTATQVLQLPYTFDQTDGVTSPNDGFVTACTDGMNDGLWYSFTGDGGYVSIKATTISDWNHQIGIYTGSCTDLVCSGTANSEGKGVGKVETLTISTVPGTIYYVNVGQYSGGTDSPEGNFKIEISKVDVFLAPTNDKCSTATKVTQLPYAWPQINGIYAANDGLITACSDGMNDGLWYSFTGDGNNTTIKATAMSDWDHQIGVYTGACTALVCAGTADNDDEEGSVETITIPTIAGTTYYVNVGYYGDSIDHTEGNFTIEITKEASLATSETSGSKANNSVKLYPNPFKDVLHISDITNIKSVLIYDMSGKLIKTIDKPDSVLYLGELKQGTYLITLQKKDGSKQTLKAIKII
ncbi:T9SS type A sorting domain-containing protein [Chryseobacterium sp. WLY505]|uniref:T9SS type A sorting domain-containing protein n=1 Tax=Chryseobacterium sp. WLY505 TaxID=3068892 RepID=UPI002796DF17|nr:T9SS type A sorting domain-containing protein [Chryseobacterium sp. WLY505]MDQ1859195.1 T9SS type A sorting domain-containing protein [Chryseobacterium sp. WLY505]